MKLPARVAKALNTLMGRTLEQKRALSSVDDSRGWRVLYDYGTSMTAWQKDLTIDRDQVLSNWAVWACVTLIAGDIGKVNLRLMDKVGDIWEETSSPAFSPVLSKPNGYQTRQQFMESWILSKLLFGNTYVLLTRDNRGVVVQMHVLDPCRVTPLIADDGSVYYQLMQDDLPRVFEDRIAVPASEIIHDRFNCLYHPLVGLSPIFSSGLAATQGQKIGLNAAKFFENMSRPSGILTAPGAISDATAQRLKENWDNNYTGDKIGKVAVLGDGLKYEQMSVTASDAQMVEMAKFSAEMICATFHVPAFKIGAGTIPAGQKVADLNEIYYADCLHGLMDAVQTLLAQGLGLDTIVRAVKFDLHDLLKMDMASLMTVLKTGIDAAIYAPNEARQKLNLPPLVGGDTVYMQQQDFPLDQVRLNKIEQTPAPPAEDDETMPDEDMADELEAA